MPGVGNIKEFVGGRLGFLLFFHSFYGDRKRKFLLVLGFSNFIY